MVNGAVNKGGVVKWPACLRKGDFTFKREENYDRTTSYYVVLNYYYLFLEETPQFQREEEFPQTIWCRRRLQVYW